MVSVMNKKERILLILIIIISIVVGVNVSSKKASDFGNMQWKLIWSIRSEMKQVKEIYEAGISENDRIEMWSQNVTIFNEILYSYRDFQELEYRIEKVLDMDEPFNLSNHEQMKEVIALVEEIEEVNRRIDFESKKLRYKRIRWNALDIPDEWFEGITKRDKGLAAYNYLREYEFKRWKPQDTN